MSRGVCSIDAEGYLKQINERTTIYRRADGQIVFEENGVEIDIILTKKLHILWF